MRRSVFLAVWLSLVLSILKGSSAETSSTTTVSTITKLTFAESTTTTPKSPTTTPTTTVTTSSTSAGSSAETSSTPTVPTTTKPAESTTTTPKSPTTTPTTTVTTSSTSAGSSAETSSTTTVSTITKPAESTTTTPKSPTTTPTTTVTTSSTSAVLVDFCRDDPCGINLAKCISLKSNYTCECQYGFYYSNQNCYRGQVYPATFAVRASYSDDVKNVNSMEYEQVFNNVSEFFEKAFQNLDGYIQTVIMDIQPLKETRNSLPRNVTVTNLFTWNSSVNETTVNSAVEFASNAAGDQSYVYLYKAAKPCDVYQCDNETTQCHEDEFPECRCKMDLEKTEWDDRSCSVCSKNCSADANKYCVKEKGVPKCRCMTNFKLKDGNCVPCQVGFSGENCEDNSKLILIIVGTVFGAIILGLAIAVSVVSVRAKRKQSPEKRSLIKPGYSDLDASDDRPTMFPRVQTTSGHANPGYQPNNPYEMRSTNRSHFPERDYDDLYEVSREPGGFRVQSRY